MPKMSSPSHLRSPRRWSARRMVGLVPVPADELIDAMVADCPGHRPGTRPSYAPGMTVTGWFQASSTAGAYSDAEHFGGRRIPVTVRFSNGTGADEPDTTRAARGMSVRFHLGEVAGDGGDGLGSRASTDLVSTTLPVFFTRTAADFLDMTRSAVGHAPRPIRWRRLAGPVEQVVGILKLLPLAKDATPREMAAVAFADRHVPARLAVAASTMLAVPESYATCCYHAVHAFRLTAGDRRTFVRFHWEPVAGVRPAPDGTKGRFLAEEMVHRLSRCPAEFVLRVQVAEAGDDTSDPTVAWSQARRRVVMGQVSLDTVVADREEGFEPPHFDPAGMVPGIEVCDDEIMAARHDAYARSAARRLAERAAARTTG